MCNMLITRTGVENVADFEPPDLFTAGTACVHVDFAGENHEDFWTVIHVPLVWFVRPMQPYRCIIHPLYIERAPSAGSSKLCGMVDFHAGISVADRLSKLSGESPPASTCEVTDQVAKGHHLRNRRVPEDIDAVDRKLLALLGSDARLSATAIAKRLNLSRTAVQERMKRLELDGVIVGYSIITKRFSGPTVTAILSVLIGQRPCGPVLSKLEAVAEARHLYSTAGPIDAVIIVEVDTPEGVSRVVDRVAAIPGVSSVTASMVLETVSLARPVINAAPGTD
jgi:Lrp/AsnC family transcriptional regulator, leucine-responsive regulatory protein